MKKILREDNNNYKYYFSPKEKPVLTIQTGERVFIQTKDAYSGRINTEKDVRVLQKVGKDFQLNPIAGPVYIEGAEPGDTIVITIEDIKVGGTRKQGVFAIEEKSGIMDHSLYTLNPSIESLVTICPIERNEVLLPMQNGEIKRIPTQPIIGTIGVAPSQEIVKSVWHTQDVCGNIDSPDMKIGTKLTLPVNVEGALFSVGDVAAITGDGEVVSHVDTDGDLILTFDLIKKENSQFIAWPQIETEDHIGSIGCELGSSLINSIRTAYKDMILRLHKYYGIELMSAYRLLTLGLEIRVNHAFFPTIGGCCTAKLHKNLLK